MQKPSLNKHLPNSGLHSQRNYKYYELVMAAFVTVLMCSNIIGASKTCNLWGFTFGAGIFFFPVSYIFGDILTEVYGYARARRVVWVGFAAQIFATFMSIIIIKLPPDPTWHHQEAYETVFGGVPRIVAASMAAYFCGEISNSYVLAKMKIWTEGRHLWTRIIGSTMAGELVDSVIFYPLAFLGVLPTETVIKLVFMQYFLKTAWEILMTPVTYRVVAFLKKAEQEDYYDRDTDFTPFSIKT